LLVHCRSGKRMSICRASSRSRQRGLSGRIEGTVRGLASHFGVHHHVRREGGGVCGWVLSNRL
jgi:hypothetical protein